MRHKVGDRVRVDNIYRLRTKGMEGTIISTIIDDQCVIPLFRVRLHGGEIFAYYETELELIGAPNVVEQKILAILNDIGNSLLRTQEAKSYAMKLDVLSTLNQVWIQLNAAHNTALKALRQEKAT